MLTMIPAPRLRQRGACHGPAGPRDTELRDLWRRHKRDGDRASRERLVLAYAPLVQFVASRVALGLPSHVDEADLVSYGLVGLIKAIDRFDAAHDVKFETYASVRIKGSIIDELRSQDWVPRSVRARGREIERVSVKLERELHRAPTEDEMAHALGMGLQDFRDTLLALANSTIIALDGLVALTDSYGDEITILDTLPDPGAPDPANLLDEDEVKDRIALAMGRLPDRERFVLGMHYYESLNLREIADLIGLSESRISQLHTQAILRLRVSVAEHQLDDVAVA